MARRIRTPVLLPMRVRAEEKDGQRVAHFIASTSDVARDGGIIEARGWMLDDYLRAHPSLLWCHDWHGLPLGSAVDARVDGGDLHAWFVFADHEMAQTCERMVFSDPPHLRAVSVGFDILEERKPTAQEAQRGARWVATKTRLNEISLVPVPADPGAVLVGSRMKQADADVIRRHFHLPYWAELARELESRAMTTREVKEVDGALVAEVKPADQFQPDSFESMFWPDAEGVEAVVGVLTDGTAKAVQGVSFDPAAFDVDTATAWLDENAAALEEWSEPVEEEAPPEDEGGSDEEMDEDKGGQREKVLAAVARVREALVAMSEAADELETLVDPEDDDQQTTDNPPREKSQGSTRGEGAGGSSGHDAPEDDPEAADPYGLLAASRSYAGDESAT